MRTSLWIRVSRPSAATRRGTSILSSPLNWWAWTAKRYADRYNGYSWLGDDNVYNPFDVLLLFRRRRFGAWWFETGTPSFLVETLTRRRIGSVDLEGMSGTNALLSAFDVDDIEPEALLFQTGYLTITGEEDVGGLPLFRLGYPNREVRQSLNEHLLRGMTPARSRRLDTSLRLRELLTANDFEGVEALFRAFFAGIPYEWHTRNEIARYEGYYASVFYSHFAAAGLGRDGGGQHRPRGEWTWPCASRATCTCSSSR